MPRGGVFILNGPGGERIEVKNLAGFCRENDWKIDAVRDVVDTSRAYKGWTVARKNPTTGQPRVQKPTPAPVTMDELPPAPPMPDPSRPREEIRRSLQGYVAWVMRANTFFAARPDKQPDGWKVNESLRIAETMAKMCGIDWKEVGDQRSLGAIVKEQTDRILNDGEEIFAATDRVIEALERGFQESDTRGTDFDHEVSEHAQMGTTDGPKARAGRARRWLGLLRRLRYLRSRVRNPYDPGVPGVSERVQRATHLIRFMLYTGRSDLSQFKEPHERLFRIGQPIIAMSMTLFYAINGAGAVEGVGTLLRGDHNPVTGRPYPGIDYAGWVALLPPRHGKTDLLKHHAVLTMNLDPRAQAAYVHAGDDEAGAMNRAVQSYFTRDTAQGRRNLSLWPIELEDYDCNEFTTRLRVPQPPKTPQHTASGIGGAKLGKSFSIIRGDDLVPSSDRFNTADREKRVSYWDGTWMSRRSGTDYFVMISGYPHHSEDLISQYAREAEKFEQTGGKAGKPFWLLKMPVGGPETDPPYFSIFPELLDSDALRKLHRSLHDRSMWPSNYQLTPRDRERQIVKQVRLYNANAPEHQQFLQGAQFFVAVDPAAKGQEGSDFAGIVIGALGDARGVTTRDGVPINTSERQIRIVFEAEFYATQSEIAQHLLDLGAQFRIDHVYVECVTGLGSAVAEMLSTYHGVHAVELEGVKNKNKRARLMAVAGMIEDSNPSMRAKVLFPGVMREGEDEPTLRAHESMDRLIRYVVDFGITDGLHSLDALTLLCRKLMDQVGVGEGVFSEQVRRAEPPMNDVQRLLDRKRREREHARGRGKFLRSLVSQGT